MQGEHKRITKNQRKIKVRKIYIRSMMLNIDYLISLILNYYAKKWRKCSQRWSRLRQPVRTPCSLVSWRCKSVRLLKWRLLNPRLGLNLHRNPLQERKSFLQTKGKWKRQARANFINFQILITTHMSTSTVSSRTGKSTYGCGTLMAWMQYSLRGLYRVS